MGLVDAVAAVIDEHVVVALAEHVLPRQAQGEGLVLQERFLNGRFQGPEVVHQFHVAVVGLAVEF